MCHWGAFSNKLSRINMNVFLNYNQCVNPIKQMDKLKINKSFRFRY